MAWQSCDGTSCPNARQGALGWLPHDHWVPEHHVAIRLRYTEWDTPWKWQGTCLCGWRCLSWCWQDGPRGALPMSLEHMHEQAR